MTKRSVPWDGQVDLVSSDDDSSSVADMETDNGSSAQRRSAEFIVNQLVDGRLSEEGTILKVASMYQEYMKKVPIPAQRGSVIPCNSWMDLAKSLKELYGQPLHYLTNVLLKQWDQARFETGHDCDSLDSIVHPLKAETTVWLIEEVHRRTASYHHLAKLWQIDPMYYTYVDSIFPKL